MDALRARLKKLSSALDAQRAAGQGTEAGEGAKPSSSGMGSVMSLAFRVMSEFISAIIVGGLIGWGIDRLAGTSPAFLIVLLLMGAAAGFWNVYRVATRKFGSGSGQGMVDES
jgi:ATP synthase protein I